MQLRLGSQAICCSGIESLQISPPHQLAVESALILLCVLSRFYLGIKIKKEKLLKQLLPPSVVANSENPRQAAQALPTGKILGGKSNFH